MTHSATACRQRTLTVLERLMPDASGIDISSTSHVVAVPGDRDDLSVREIAAYIQAAS